MTYSTEYNIRDKVRAKDPRSAKAQDFIIGQTRIMTLESDPSRWVVEHRSISPDVKFGRGTVAGKWYPEKYILGIIQ